MHDRARTRVGHALPVDGDLTAAERDRNRENAALSGGFDVPGHRDHGGEPVALWSGILSTTGAHAHLPAFFALLARTRFADLRVFAHPNASHSIFCFFSASSFCSLRRVRAAGATAPGNSICFRAFPADSFLPRVSAREYVSCHRGILCRRSHCAPSWSVDHFYWRS